MVRQTVSTGSPWEPVVGYSRAVRIGNWVAVAGTTATTEAGDIIGLGDPYAQTAYCLQKIKAALKEVGATVTDVIRTRMYVINIDDWELIAQAHREVFGTVRPAATMVQVSRLVDPRHLVEIEVDAVLE